MLGRMKRETPDQKWNRLQAQVQAGIERAYTNPARKGCLNREEVAELAKRSVEFDDSVEQDPQWKHVTHCSPCYAEYLEEFRKRGRAKPTLQ
jgi:hypothetical protein